jgi:hypothetical protein
MHIEDGPVVVPTPPPEIDVELWLSSVDKLEELGPDRIGATHCGFDDDVPARLAAMRAYLAEWVPLARELDERAWVERYEAWLRGEVDENAFAAYRQAGPPKQLWAGLDRYWRRKAG